MQLKSPSSISSHYMSTKIMHVLNPHLPVLLSVTHSTCVRSGCLRRPQLGISKWEVRGEGLCRASNQSPVEGKGKEGELGEKRLRLQAPSGKHLSTRLGIRSPVRRLYIIRTGRHQTCYSAQMAAIHTLRTMALAHAVVNLGDSSWAGSQEHCVLPMISVGAWQDFHHHRCHHFLMRH